MDANASHLALPCNTDLVRPVDCGIMTVNHSQHRPHSSNAFARERDRKVLWLLERHPATAGILVQIGLFPSRKKASKRLARLAKRKQLRCLGTAQIRGGRPEHVYGHGWWKGDNLVHEVQLTRVCLKIDAEEIRRGPGDVDPFLWPDAELVFGGRRYCLELDCGTMSPTAIVRKRFARYRTCRDTTLWVCPSATRVERLRRHAAMVRATALFTTLDQALSNPHAPIWVDFEGTTTALPRNSQGVEKPGDIAADKGGDNPVPLSPPASDPATTPVPFDVVPRS
jgi:hypothetical protein